MKVKLPIYMDNHATTRVDPRVVEAMLPYFSETFGNAASRNHEFGWRAEEAVETARGRIARLIGASPKEIVFTSGATESNNLALKGLAQRRADRGNHIITCVSEHKAVLDPCRRLEKEGFRVSYLPVGSDGLLDVERLTAAITDKTILISAMYANNETGVVQSIAEIGRLARERRIAFHVDGAQAVGKISVDVERDAIDLLSFTAHKLYGPKGIGALYVRRRAPRVEIAAQMDGGGHERGMRSGTLNVPAIVGFGRACEICGGEMAAESLRLAALRDRLKDGLFARIGEIAVNGSLEHRLPHNLSVSFAHVDGESLLMGLAPDVAVASGSACTSATPEPSHVLRAMGVPERLAHSSIRFGLGRFNTEEEVDHVDGKVEQVVGRLRELSPRYSAARK
jgi:cysteine desulfurase